MKSLERPVAAATISNAAFCANAGMDAMLASVLTPAPFTVFQRSSRTPTSFSDVFSDGETEEDFVGADTDFETVGAVLDG